MPEPARDDPGTANRRDSFGAAVAGKAERKMRARRRKDRSIWFGLGMFGLVGWTVAVPTIAGLALGIWIDTRSESTYSWTLMGLITGLGIGCLMAWNWVRRESADEEDE